jgi:hypothetical protein
VEYAQLLIQECRNLNLIGDKIWIWDRRFFECSCSGLKNKKTGMLSDPDAGHYVKKTERIVSYLEQGIPIHPGFPSTHNEVGGFTPRHGTAVLVF